MKKFALILAMMMLFLMVAGCAASSDPVNTSSNETGSTTTVDTASSQTSSNTSESSSPSNISKEPFDDYARPTIVKEGIKIGYLIRQIEAESQARSLRQAEIECFKRGWTLIPVIYEVDTNFRDAFLNLLNQKVDTIILGSTESMEAKQDLIDQARNAGIGVYANDTQLIDGVISNCTMPNGVATMEMIYKLGIDYTWHLNVAVLTAKASQTCRERIEPILCLFDGIYPSMKLLATEDANSTSLGVAQACFEFGQTWMQKFGDELQCIYTAADGYGFCIAEAIVQAGDPHGKKCFLVGFDGGSKAWSYIRNDTPFKYSYAQPFELYTHNVFEIVQDVQVEGLNPGEEGCLISKPGDSLFFSGKVINMTNVPEIGASFHSVFDYYDQNDADAWYNWDDGKGAAVVKKIG